MSKFLVLVLATVLVVCFQNCKKGFEAVDLSSTSDSSILGGEKLASPFAKSKVSLKNISRTQTNASGKISDGTSVVDPSMMLAILIDNTCAQIERLNTRLDAFDNLISVDFSRLNKKMKVQAFEASAKKQVSLAELKTVIEKNSCVIGLTHNGLANINLAFKDIEKNQDHHRAVRTVAGYTNYFGSLTSSQSGFVKVAVIDTGADITHPDLRDVHWRSAEGDMVIDFTAEANGLDGNGHGTHVAGLIAAKFNSVTGTSGVASNVKIMSLKALNKDGSGTVTDIANAILYAVDNDADVINMSLGGGWNLVDDIYLEAFRYAANKNIPVIVAAGNEAVELKPFGYNSPADMGQVPGVIVVGSVHSSNLERSSFSNFGSLVDISAPGSYAKGSCVLSTLPVLPSKYGEQYSTSKGYGSLCGTSMATPIVAGAAALLIQALKSKNIPYSSQSIELILAQNGQVGKAPDLGKNNVLDLNRLSIYLSSLVDLPEEIRGVEVQSPLARYISNLYMNILYRKYDSEGFRYYHELLDSRRMSLAEVNSRFVNSDEFKNLGITSGVVMMGDPAYTRLYLNILGRNPTSSEVMTLANDLTPTPGSKADRQDIIAALFVKPEALSVLQKLGLEGVPVFDEDKSYPANQVKERQRKRVAAFSYFETKFGRSPASEDVRAVSGFLDSETAQGAVDLAFQAEPSDLTSFIISQHQSILDRKSSEVTKEEISLYRQKILSHEIDRAGFISILNNSNEKKVRDIYKEFTINLPFKFQVDALVAELQNGTKTLAAVRETIQQQISMYDSTYILAQVEFLLGKHLLRSTMIKALAPFKMNDAEKNIWVARFKALKSWSLVENEMTSLPEAIAYKLYLNLVGRTPDEIYDDYGPVQASIASLVGGQTESDLSQILANSDEKYVRNLYATHFLKTPGKIELYGYLNGLKSGKYSRDSIRTYLEGRSRSPDLTISPEPPKTSLSNADFIKAKYKEILDRTDAEISQDSVGFNFWLSALDKSQVTRLGLENYFRASHEYFLRQAYKTELRRRADFTGLRFWIQELESGRVTRDAVVAQFKRTCAEHIGGECQ